MVSCTTFKAYIELSSSFCFPSRFPFHHHRQSPYILDSYILHWHNLLIRPSYPPPPPLPARHYSAKRIKAIPLKNQFANPLNAWVKTLTFPHPYPYPYPFHACFYSILPTSYLCLKIGNPTHSFCFHVRQTLIHSPERYYHLNFPLGRATPVYPYRTSFTHCTLYISTVPPISVLYLVLF